MRGGSGIGRAFGLSPLVVGLTVVAFATSAPELAVTVDATFSGAAGLAIGNVAGSNITNILLVLGMAALVLPVTVRSQLVRVDVPVLIFLSLLMLVLALNGLIGRLEGLLLLAVLLVYLFWSIRTARRAATAKAGAGVKSEAHPRLARDAVFVVAGLALLVLGARFLVDAATEIARIVGLSDLVIGLTVVSIGTSLPEVATSIIAALRGEREMALGNAVAAASSTLVRCWASPRSSLRAGSRSRPPPSGLLHRKVTVPVTRPDWPVGS
ncbi:calcium/sodium antiporter [Actinoplanes solisilvae]|uniref:calcium/sodium antiporter n=1 Tax=Actinoplanes solisilvae TaxID=2486853 RepID=UPI00196B60AB|nr:calcium/sodium antiporter [Actinoplanes solisilvae]